MNNQKQAALYLSIETPALTDAVLFQPENAEIVPLRPGV